MKYESIKKVHAFPKGTFSNRSNPICPHTGKDCFNFYEYVNCRECSEYGRGVRATGSAPILHSIVESIKKLFKWN